MDSLITLFYIAVFIICVIFDARKKQKKKEKEVEVITSNKEGRKPIHSQRSSEVRQSRNEGETSSKDTLSSLEQMLESVMQKRKPKEKGTIKSSHIQTPNNSSVSQLQSSLNIKSKQEFVEEEGRADLDFLSELNSADGLKKAFLYSEILNRKY